MIWRCCVANPKDRPRFKSICQALHDRLILGKPIDLTNDKGTKGDNQGYVSGNFLANSGLPTRFFSR